jgi:hypothetical protein
MAVAEEEHRLVRPGLGVEAVLVVVVVGSLSHGRVPPGPRDVPGGERVFQEMEREGLEGHHAAKSCPSRLRLAPIADRRGGVERRDVVEDVEAVCV